MDELNPDVKRKIIQNEIDGVNQQLYRLEISAKARKLAGFSDEENKPLVGDIERLMKVRDALAKFLSEVAA